MGQIVVIGRERMRDLAGPLQTYRGSSGSSHHPLPRLRAVSLRLVDSGQRLPQNIVTAIRQTRDGYLWIATFDGLARFDGVRFTVFNRANSPGIYSNRFTSLFEDTRGDLWMGTEIGSVTRYTGGRFITYSAPNGLSARFVRAFSGDAAGNVWVLSDDTIRQWQPDGERFVEIGAPVSTRRLQAPRLDRNWRRLGNGSRGAAALRERPVGAPVSSGVALRPAGIRRAGAG